MDFSNFLSSIDAQWVYLFIALIVGLESMGLPLPGETVVVASAVLSAAEGSSLNPVAVAASASAGAVVGDSLGYLLGRTFGVRLIAVLRRPFPRHFSPDYVAYAEHLFARYGFATVFFGRFVALLRILAGPLAGVLHMPYRRFLAANATGGIVWACLTTAVVYTLGRAAEHWLQRGAWVALGIVLIGGLLAGAVLRQKLDANVAAYRASRESGTLGQA